MRRQVHRLLLISIACVFPAGSLAARDYFLTIGGGYNPSGNQASLEANVVFFQQLVKDKHPGPLRHDVYFADGDDPAADLQIVADKPERSDSPATELLAALHRRRGQLHVTYRNHRVGDIAGPLDPVLIRAALEALAKTVQSGDRVIIYVTAHGSEGPQGDRFNTTIDCWRERTIRAREFSEWLSNLPPAVPVVMVMAQCYCGGFAHTIFQGLDETKGLAPQLRAGFFAQQHDLPAAGCRPDIEHDEEFSSYFWGALAGRSRNGVPIEGCDIDGNGVISFAEAYAYAVTAGETIDIPLRTSDVLLRRFSRLGAQAGASSPLKKGTVPPGDADMSRECRSSERDSPLFQQPARGDSGGKPETSAEPKQDAPPARDNDLAAMNGTLQSFVVKARPVSARIVTSLGKSLGFATDAEVASVVKAYDEHRRGGRFQGRGRGGRRGSERRNLLKEVAEKWPELADERHWEESSLLKPENQQQLLSELKQLPGWKGYAERLQRREAASEESERHELQAAKFRRLIAALETIVLDENLPRCATPETVARYRQLLALEESALSPGESR